MKTLITLALIFAATQAHAVFNAFAVDFQNRILVGGNAHND